MFDLLYSHGDFIVINKHPNVSVHKDDGDTMLLQTVQQQLSIEKLYLVHRLDKMTSGILLLAKNGKTASELSGLFAQRNIEKYYLAIANKKPKKKQGLIVGDMVRSRRSAWKLTSSTDNPAVTQFFSYAGEPGERVFLCKPSTGKTHQIRVAIKSVGSAIAGDPIYNPTSNCDRGYLHAFAVRFSHCGQQYEFVCDPREYQLLGEKWHSESVSTVIDNVKQPWQLTWPNIKH
ncbi:TIGR01621 family pseudouridine synthase [Vibrio marisflavi]|uniref:Ribosomal large subunit pseudouridine synthase C n=1 Tax=Vibrio marisflavi CECT 7928 TaxID=634439 RepID=A0ABM9A5K3_9VIBR|nr:TIGR01621 family pseudouridine synthase [Vibrio marisflavi]CAH0540439.1 Ribosomal large subunit pseudouridine synthase C [Vibrio marisflavi CECT 7928]